MFSKEIVFIDSLIFYSDENSTFVINYYYYFYNLINNKKIPTEVINNFKKLNYGKL